MWSEGEAFLVRYESADGVIRGALPTRVVGERNGYLATWLAPGTTIAQPILADGRDLHDVTALERNTLPRASWIGPRRREGALILFPAAAAHSIHAFPHGWYVNLERKHVWHDRGVDTRDHILDIVCSSSRRWKWKDEDELRDSVVHEIVSAKLAAEIRAEGDRVVELIERWTPPFSDGWENWRPDPAWPAPLLPDDWAAA